MEGGTKELAKLTRHHELLGTNYQRHREPGALDLF